MSKRSTKRRSSSQPKPNPPKLRRPSVPDSQPSAGGRSGRARRRSSQDRTAAIAIGVALVILAVAVAVILLRNRPSQTAASSTTPAATLSIPTSLPGTTTAPATSSPGTPAPTRTPRPTPAGDRPLAAKAPGERNGIFATPPPMTIDPNKHYTATIATEVGDIVVRLFPDKAPKTVNNFVFLARQGFFDGVTFHRVIEDFMAQGGDPTGTGTGGPGYQFEDETNNGLVFDKPGLLAMANAGPNTNGSQFFITFVPTPWLNGKHTIFGEVVQGMDLLKLIKRREPGTPTPGTVIDWISITEGP